MKKYKLGEWEVDPEANLLTREGKEVRLEPKAMMVLDHLMSNAGNAVARSDLEDVCWRNRVVGYDALSNAIIKIRKSLRHNTNKNTPVYVETVPKFGYRLVAPISEIPTKKIRQLETSRPSKAQTIGAIAVLPFRTDKRCQSDSYEQQALGDRLAEDILVALCRIPKTTVIARTSSFRYRNEPDFTQIANDLNVSNIIDGSVRGDSDKLDIRITLNECSGSTILWADRFVISNTATMENLDSVCGAAVTAICAALGMAQQLATNRGTQHELAYSSFLKGRELDRRDTQATNKLAREHFQQAIQIDANFSSAHSYLSRNLAVCFINLWNGYHENQLQEGIEHAYRAIELDPENPHAHFAKAACSLWLHDFDTAILSAARAIEIDSNFAEAHAVEGMIHLYNGDSYRALEPLQNAMKLDPHFRDAYQHIIAQAFFHLRDYKKASELLLLRLIRKPESDTSRVLLAATYGYLGDTSKACEQWQQALALNPEYSLDHKRRVLPYREPQMFDEIVHGLELAGISNDQTVRRL